MNGTPTRPTQDSHIDHSIFLADERTSLAFERSRLAADRTLMAWIRTSLSMISFGFTIYKFFQYLVESDSAPNFIPTHRPRNFGLALVIFGIVLLGFAIMENVVFLKRLAKDSGRKFPKSTALAGALIITLFGIIALIGLVFRIGPF